MQDQLHQGIGGSVVVCPQCGTENPDGARFCLSCGLFLRVAGSLYQQRSKPLQAGASAQESVQSTDVPRPSLLEQALAASDKGDIVTAIELCRAATAENPANGAAFSLLGVLYERLGEKQRAIEAYEHALRLNPGSTADREHLAHLKGQDNRQPEDEITQTFWPSEEPEPLWMRRPVQIAAAAVVGFVLIVSLLAWGIKSHQSRRRTETTVSQAQEKVKLGDIHAAQGHWNQAQRAYLEATRLDPNNAEAKKRLQQLRYWAGRTQTSQAATARNQRPRLLPPRSDSMFNWHFSLPQQKPKAPPPAAFTTPISRTGGQSSGRSTASRSATTSTPPPLISQPSITSVQGMGPAAPSAGGAVSAVPVPSAPSYTPGGAVTAVEGTAGGPVQPQKPKESVMVVKVVEQPTGSSPPAGGAVEPVEAPAAPKIQPARTLAEQQLDRARALRDQGRYAEAAAACQKALDACQSEAAGGDIRSRNVAEMAKRLKELCERRQQGAAGGS